MGTKSDDNSSHGLKARCAKKGIYVKLLLAMYLQLKFELILTQSQPNFAEMILGGSLPKMCLKLFA
jgi:hypothetical protein